MLFSQLRGDESPLKSFLQLLKSEHTPPFLHVADTRFSHRPGWMKSVPKRAGSPRRSFSQTSSWLFSVRGLRVAVLRQRHPQPGCVNGNPTWVGNRSDRLLLSVYLYACSPPESLQMHFSTGAINFSWCHGGGSKHLSDSFYGASNSFVVVFQHNGVRWLNIQREQFFFFFFTFKTQPSTADGA